MRTETTRVFSGKIQMEADTQKIWSYMKRTETVWIPCVEFNRVIRSFVKHGGDNFDVEYRDVMYSGKSKGVESAGRVTIHIMDYSAGPLSWCITPKYLVGFRVKELSKEMQSAVVDTIREFGGVMKESSGKQVIVDPKYDRSQIPVMTYKEIYEKLGPVIITDENPEASLEEYLPG